jgi:HAD superfamily hydrolase (TIGR01493 family)
MIRGVLFDWRGTLVADPPDEWWITRAFERLARNQTEATAVVEALRAAAQLPEVAEHMHHLDCSAAQHRAATMLWFHTAGLDDELADVLYHLDFDPANHPFFPDVADTLRALRERSIATSVVSDIHFDVRPEFSAAGLHEFIDSYVLSFEHGVQKPDPEIFEIAADSVSLAPDELLMVGDRASHDGGAVAIGITTLLFPPFRSAIQPRNLGRVIALIDGTKWGRP